MTKKETFQFIALIRSSFPTWNKSCTQQELNLIAFNWFQHFSDVPLSAMASALMNYQLDNKFAPTVSDIRDSLKKLSMMISFNETQGTATPQLIQIREQIDSHFTNTNILDRITIQTDYFLESGKDERP